MTDLDKIMINMLFEIVILEIKTYRCVKVVITKMHDAVSSFMAHMFLKYLQKLMHSVSLSMSLALCPAEATNNNCSASKTAFTVYMAKGLMEI